MSGWDLLRAVAVGMNVYGGLTYIDEATGRLNLAAAAILLMLQIADRK